MVTVTLPRAKGDTGAQGHQGPQGVAGPKGDTGPQGVQGEKGDRGFTGATPELTIGAVTTGTPGTLASASITGTVSAPVLNLVLPRGQTGSLAVSLADYAVNGAVVQASFQSAVDALSADGGTVLVDAGNYASINPAGIVVPLHKMVSWIDPTDSLPAGMPGAVWTSGFEQQPYEGQLGKASRPGDAFVRIKTATHVPDPSQANQQDSIFMVEGHVPNTAGPLDHEYRGFTAIMSSESDQPDASIRGYHATVVGDGGKAKLRSIRTASIGLNGHEGLVVGALHTAIRTGVIPASMGGDGTAEFTSGAAGPYSTQDAAIIGAVGPGIRHVFRAEGQEGAEKPQSAFAQARGNQAILPEIAVLDLHGGGAGDILKVSADGTTGGGGTIARMNRDGRLYARSFRSTDTGLVVADDAVGLITGIPATGFFKFWAAGSSTIWGEIFYRAGAGGEANGASSSLGSTTTVGTQGVQLTGTTGVDGRVTVSVFQNSIQIENRSGGSRNFGFLFTGL